MRAGAATRPRGRPNRPYAPPADVRVSNLVELLDGVRPVPGDQQARLGLDDARPTGPPIWIAGDASLLLQPAVAIVGTREPSEAGVARAGRLARELAAAGVVVVSGLARGIDRAAHAGALEVGGRTVAVIGTPIDTAYPVEHAALQQEICERHLLVSPFAPGKRVFPSNFPQRNRLMAALTDATCIIEAGETSGTLHQAAECQRLQRWLFIARSIVEDSSLKWPASFLSGARTRVLTSTQDVLDAIG